MGVKEKDLQTVESLSAGDKIRIVTGGGNSKNVDAGAVGGAFYVTIDWDADPPALDASYNDIIGAINNGQIPIVVDGQFPIPVDGGMYSNTFSYIDVASIVHPVGSDEYIYSVFFVNSSGDTGIVSSTSADDPLVLQLNDYNGGGGLVDPNPQNPDI